MTLWYILLVEDGLRNYKYRKQFCLYGRSFMENFESVMYVKQQYIKNFNTRIYFMNISDHLKTHMLYKYVLIINSKVRWFSILSFEPFDLIEFYCGYLKK